MSHQTDLTLTGGLLFNFTPPTVLLSAGVTLTPAQLLAGMVDRGMGGSKTDVLPTAADLLAAMSRGGYTPAYGTSFDCVFRNTAAATDVLTLTLGAGMVLVAVSTLTVAAASQRTLRFMVNNAGGINVYSLGQVLT